MKILRLLSNNKFIKMNNFQMNQKLCKLLENDI